MRDAHKSIRVSFLDPCPWPWAHPQTLGPCEHRLPTTRPNPITNLTLKATLVRTVFVFPQFYYEGK